MTIGSRDALGTVENQHWQTVLLLAALHLFHGLRRDERGSAPLFPPAGRRPNDEAGFVYASERSVAPPTGLLQR
jgi:hypothetical protein